MFLFVDVFMLILFGLKLVEFVFFVYEVFLFFNMLIFVFVI